MTPQKAFKIVRRLQAAEGYLDLGMAKQAITELEGIRDPGPFAPPMHYLRGRAFKAERQFDDAIKSLREAARAIPAPHNRVIWLSLSECFRERGQIKLADAIRQYAHESAKLAESESEPVPLLKIAVYVEPIPHDEDSRRAGPRKPR